MARPTSRNLSLIFTLSLTALLIWMIAEHFSIKAFSDPFNYLMYARNLGEEFFTSRWPAAYPAYLWLVLQLVGPYYVFLANIPILALLLFLFYCLSSRIASHDRTFFSQRTFLGLGAVSLLLVFDPSIIIYLVSPYRDLMSHTFLLAMALSLLRHLTDGRERTAWLFLAGLCLGAASSIREPAILMAIPAGLTMLAFTFPSPWSSWWRRGFWFVAGTAIGLLPLLIQTYLATGQAIVPPQAVQEQTLLPGFVPGRAGENLRRALWYYVMIGGPLYTVAFMAGAVLSIIRRNRFILYFCLPSVLLYTLVYILYRAFFARYFFVVTLWAVPVAAFGLYGLMRAIFHMARTRWIQDMGPALLTGALLVFAAYRIATLEPQPSRFITADAKRFERDLESVVPEGAYVVCPRNLCEVISWFSHAESWRAWARLLPDLSSGQPLYNRFKAMLDAKRPLFVVRVEALGDNNPDEVLFRRYFDLLPVATLRSEAYNLQGVTGPGSFFIFEVAPWTASNVVYSFTGIPPRSLLRIDPGALWREDYPERSFARVFANEKPIGFLDRNGPHYFQLEDAEVLDIRVVSDAPISSSMPVEIISMDQPVTLHFGLLSANSHDAYLSDSIRNRPTRDGYFRPLHGHGQIQLPPIHEPGALLIGHLYVRAFRDGDTNDVPVLVTAGEGSATHHQINPSLMGAAIPFVLPFTGREEDRVLNITLEDDQTRISLNHMIIYRQRENARFNVDLGAHNDGAWILSGFHRAERYHGRAPVRWTSANAHMIFNLSETADDFLLAIIHQADDRPSGAPPKNTRLTFNDRTLDPSFYHDRTENGFIRTEARIPGAWVVHGDNRLAIYSTPWVPQDYLPTSDDRALGLMIRHVELSPVPSMESIP